MDPEFNAPMPQGKYIGVRGSRFRWLLVCLLFSSLLGSAQYCEQFQNSPRIYPKIITAGICKHCTEMETKQ